MTQVRVERHELLGEWRHPIDLWRFGLYIDSVTP